METILALVKTFGIAGEPEKSVSLNTALWREL